MNTSDSQNPVVADPRLPALSQDRIEVIEAGVFDDIAADRGLQTQARRRRRRIWTGVGAAAGVLVVAAVIAPMVGSIVSPTQMSDVALAPSTPEVGLNSAEGSAAGGLALEPMPGAVADTQLRSADQNEAAAREIIASASATVVVDDIPAASRQIAQAAVAGGGYVESMTIGQSGVVMPVDGMLRESLPSSPDGGWVTVRVPSEQLSPLVEQLADVGEVTASSLNRQDVTDQAIDLRARIDSAQASVSRLTELMAEATTVADLISAESALAERQATLESYQQQLEYLEAQVDMSSLTVSLQPRTVAVEADPAGFGDGLAAGWNGLIATMNGIVVALGFLLPWIVVALAIAAAIWGIRVLVRRRRSSRTTPSSPDDE